MPEMPWIDGLGWAGFTRLVWDCGLGVFCGSVWAKSEGRGYGGTDRFPFFSDISLLPILLANELFPRTEKIAATIGGERHGREIWKKWDLAWDMGGWWLRGGFRV